MLPRKERLARSGEFREVYARGRSYANEALVLWVLPGKRDTKAGFRVSRRIGKAVLRNRVRRRLREAYRQLRETIPSGWYLVVVARDRCREMGMLELKKALRELVGRARIGSPG